MALFSHTTLEQVRAANDIVDVIGGCIPLKRAGANFTALCPFHKEKSPSFNVNPQRQIFHCFGCQKGGDVFTFIKEYENIPFVDAVRRLAERARIPIEMDDSPARQEQKQVKDVLLQIHEQLTQRWRFGVRAFSLEIPAGAIDAGEDPVEAGLRELVEETGHTPADRSKVVLLGATRPNSAFMQNRSAARG